MGLTWISWVVGVTSVRLELRGAARNLLIGLGALVAVIGLSGCVGRGGSVPYEPKGFVAPDQETLSPSLAQQRIGPLDKLRISVFQVAELSGDFQVDGQGKVQFPLVGEITAQGLLPQELAAQLATRLEQRYLRSPNVQVTIVEQSEQTITVDGAVRQPGVLPIRGTTTLMRAVALAHGMSEDANPARVVIFRTINGQRMAAAFDMRTIRRAETQDPVIYGNDIVVVDGQRTRAIWREIISTIPLVGYFAPLIP